MPNRKFWEGELKSLSLSLFLSLALTLTLFLSVFFFFNAHYFIRSFILYWWHYLNTLLGNTCFNFCFFTKLLWKHQPNFWCDPRKHMCILLWNLGDVFIVDGRFIGALWKKYKTYCLIPEYNQNFTLYCIFRFCKEM